MKPFKVKYQCERCSHEFELKYHGWYPTTQCPNCGDVARMITLKHKKHERFNLAFNKYKEVTAFGTDENGRKVAIDTKGKRIDPKDTRYDLDNDEFGWQALGKKVKGYERH
jgi:uncharacterized Zn finger protein